MEKQEKNKTEQNPMPLGMILDHAREDMTKSVVALQQKYGLPASLLDVILCAVRSTGNEVYGVQAAEGGRKRWQMSQRI